MTRKPPLEGLRVADFCWVGAGSFTTKLLADHGADVVKVESRAKVDGLRLAPPFAESIAGVNRSGYFADRNTNKRSITLDLKTDEGRRLARELVLRSDVVANNFTPGTMDRFGLGYQEVRALKPDIIYLAMSMQGDAGPERDYLGYGLTIGALVGLTGLTGLPGVEPAGTGTNYPDHIPNPCHAAFAVLSALRHRRRTGEGQYIDIAQTEPTIALMGSAFLEQTLNGVEPKPEGNGHRRFAPHGVYQGLGDDRWIAVAVRDDTEWTVLVEMLGVAPGHDDRQAWSSAAGRHADRVRLDAWLGSVIAGREIVELAAALQARGVPAGAVLDVQGVVEDRQLRARGHFVELEHWEMGRTVYNRPPFRLGSSAARQWQPAPLIGEHTTDIARNVLGLSDDDVERLTVARILR